MGMVPQFQLHLWCSLSTVTLDSFLWHRTIRGQWVTGAHQMLTHVTLIFPSWEFLKCQSGYVSNSKAQHLGPTRCTSKINVYVLNNHALSVLSIYLWRFHMYCKKILGWFKNPPWFVWPLKNWKSVINLTKNYLYMGYVMYIWVYFKYTIYVLAIIHHTGSHCCSTWQRIKVSPTTRSFFWYTWVSCCV